MVTTVIIPSFKYLFGRIGAAVGFTAARAVFDLVVFHFKNFAAGTGHLYLSHMHSPLNKLSEKILTKRHKVCKRL